MIRRNHLVEIERVEELALLLLSPPHHRPLPRIIVLFDGITVQSQSQREFCNTIRAKRTCFETAASPPPQHEERRFTARVSCAAAPAARRNNRRSRRRHWIAA